MVNGNVPGGQPGITTTNNYNNRLLPSVLSALSSINLLNLSYSYFANGAVQQITNNRDTTRNQTFTYDELRRVKTAASTTLWCNQFNYDRYGNLLQKVLTCGTGESLTVSADVATNRLVGYSYDAAGNQLSDGLGHTFTYNGENKMASVSPSGVTFTYDGDGVRIKKSGWRMYWTGMGTEVLAESDLSGVMQKEYIYFAGQRVAFRSVPTDTPYYYFSDHLGSANVITNGSGSSIQAESDFFPFGGERMITNLINNRYEFTGKEQDTSSEGGLTHFLFREYTTNLGRFMSPDLLPGDLSDPQSLNRYVYVLDDPLNFVDPFGLDHCEPPARHRLSDGQCVVPGRGEDEPGGGPGPNDAIGNGPGASGGCSVRMGLFTIRLAACPGAGGRGGRGRERVPKRNSGFTLGIRNPNQTFGQCMQTHASDYSFVGLTDLATNDAISSGNSGVKFAANTFGGNSLTGTYYAFAGTTRDSAYNAVTTGAGFTGNVVSGAMGSTLTQGRRTSDLMSLNFGGKGGLPQALSSTTGKVKSFIGKLGTGALKLAADTGFTLAEGLGCLIPQ